MIFSSNAGLSLDHPLLPQYLQDVGYITHLLGLTSISNSANVLLHLRKMALGILSPSIPSHQQRFPLPLWILECRGRLLEVRPAFADTRFRSKRALDWENFYGYDFHENLEITREPAGIYSTEVYAARAEQIIRFFVGKPILGRQLCFQVPAQVPQHQLSDVPAVSTPVGTHTA